MFKYCSLGGPLSNISPGFPINANKYGVTGATTFDSHWKNMGTWEWTVDGKNSIL
jgi:hypothetical protein